MLIITPSYIRPLPLSGPEKENKMKGMSSTAQRVNFITTIQMISWILNFTWI